MGAANNVRVHRIGWQVSLAMLVMVFACCAPPQSWAQPKPQPEPTPSPAPSPAPAPTPSPAPAPAPPNWRAKETHEHVVAAAKEVVRLSNELTKSACGTKKPADVKSLEKELKRERKNLNARAYFEALESPEIKKMDADRQAAYGAAQGQPADSEAAKKLKDIEQRREKLTNETTAKIVKTILEETEAAAAAAAECTPRAAEPPKPVPKEPEKPKDKAKEQPKATDESDERQEIGEVPKCSEGGAQPCSAEQPSGSENASHDSGGLGSFLGNVSIGIGEGHGHGEHRRDRDHDKKHDTGHKKDTDHKQDSDKEKDKEEKDQESPDSQP